MSSASEKQRNVEAIVVAYRSADVIGPCLESLLAEPEIDRIHVVDNSPDVELGVVDSDVVRVHRPGSNLGFGNGVNFAADHLESEFVAIVNPDTITTQGTVGACTRYLSQNPGVALVSPRVYVSGELFRTSERAPSLMRFLSYPMGLGGRFGVSRSHADHMLTHDTVALNGAYLVGRRSALEEAGWFDSDIFLFGEETDLCRRLRVAGYRISYLADGRVDHVDGLSSDRAAIDISAFRRSARVEQLRRFRGPLRATLYKRLITVADKWRTG